ncbi:putative hydrolase of HD superfamily [Deinococcus metalli]|uniref:Phosphohydrolase n=1 Tax=Deinococcus metalli TaxID=1141878 RepID=A0A7W8KKW3_9DEIO|nr:HD domain-containing protein [Deinococcus metalli]MBB5378871.1 putative hydrolase of HD superfamily [Deinococcus metalli]GHF62323.1 phosphohydrolase [Deinococcus metalli]
MTTLADHVAFLLACDRLKAVTRSTYLHDGSRPENSAEHSWHAALMAVTLAEHAPAGTDVNRVVRLLLVHDLVEIHAGNLHFAAPEAEHAAQAQAEEQAAHALYGLLPEAQRAEFHALRAEFEARATPEARFARALDALQPVLLTWGGDGLGCAAREPDLTAARVLRLKEGALRDFPALWTLAQDVVARAVASGTLPA